jgi:hypothetical protein
MASATTLLALAERFRSGRTGWQLWHAVIDCGAPVRLTFAGRRVRCVRWPRRYAATDAIEIPAAGAGRKSPALSTTPAFDTLKP